MKKLISSRAAEKFEDVNIKNSLEKDILTEEEVENILEVVQNMVDRPMDEFGNTVEDEFISNMDCCFEDDDFGENVGNEDFEFGQEQLEDDYFNDDYIISDDTDLFDEADLLGQDLDGQLFDEIFDTEDDSDRPIPDVNVNIGCTHLFDLLENEESGAFIICKASIFGTHGEEVRYLVYDIKENSVEQLTYEDILALEEKGEILNSYKDGYFEDENFD